MTPKKITIIGPKSFGYIDFVIQRLEELDGYKAHYINFSNFKYQYKSKADRLKNSMNKLFVKKNIKKTFRSEQVLKSLEGKGKQDIIVVIRPDKLDEKVLGKLKNKTDRLYAFYFDSITNFPDKIALIPYFDKVF